MGVISLSTVKERSLEDLWSLETLGIRDSAEKISQKEHEFPEVLVVDL